jgi:hypothetical protein
MSSNQKIVGQMCKLCARNIPGWRRGRPFRSKILPLVGFLNALPGIPSCLPPSPNYPHIVRLRRTSSAFGQDSALIISMLFMPHPVTHTDKRKAPVSGGFSVIWRRGRDSISIRLSHYFKTGYDIRKTNVLKMCHFFNICFAKTRNLSAAFMEALAPFSEKLLP